MLYVSGRPNWEFKFLRRALEEDDQIELAGLVRIARRQPKFDFRNPRDPVDQPLVRWVRSSRRGNGRAADQPVLIRLGTSSTAWS